MAENKAENRKHYLGRNKLLEIISGKSDSTKKFLRDGINQQLNGKKDAANKLKAMAKKLGVKITKIEIA